MKYLKTILLTIFVIILSNCEIKVRDVEAQIKNKSTKNYIEHIDPGRIFTYAKGGIYTDRLGCSWLYIIAGSSDGGVGIVHHPTCSNTKHLVKK